MNKHDGKTKFVLKFPRKIFVKTNVTCCQYYKNFRKKIKCKNFKMNISDNLVLVVNGRKIFIIHISKNLC